MNKRVGERSGGQREQGMRVGREGRGGKEGRKEGQGTRRKGEREGEGEGREEGKFLSDGKNKYYSNRVVIKSHKI